MFVAVLSSAGFKVIQAADGFVALETLKAQAIAAVVLDLHMPVLDGFALLDRLDDPPPVVVATADYAYDDDVARRRDKVFAFVHKPVLPELLVALVGKAVMAGQ